MTLQNFKAYEGTSAISYINGDLHAFANMNGKSCVYDVKTQRILREVPGDFYAVLANDNGTFVVFSNLEEDGSSLWSISAKEYLSPIKNIENFSMKKKLKGYIELSNKSNDLHPNEARLNGENLFLRETVIDAAICEKSLNAAFLLKFPKNERKIWIFDFEKMGHATKIGEVGMKWDILCPTSKVFVDRDYVFQKIPSELLGSSYIVRREDQSKSWLKKSGGSAWITLEFDAIVYAIFRWKYLGKTEVDSSACSLFIKDGWELVSDTLETTYSMGEQWDWKIFRKKYQKGYCLTSPPIIEWKDVPIIFAFKKDIIY